MEIDFDSWELVDTTTSVPQTLDPSEESTLEHFDWTEPKELDPHYFDYPYHPKSPHLQEDKDEALILVVQDKLKGINADAKSKSRHFRQSSLDMFEVITCVSLRCLSPHP